MMKKRSLTFRIFRMIGIVIIVFLTILFTINLSFFDEELKQEVVSIMQPMKAPKNDQNAYFALQGLAASNEKNIIDVGVALVERYRENKANGTAIKITQADYEEIQGGLNLDKNWASIQIGCNARRGIDCVPEMPNDFDWDDTRLLVMLKRYEKTMLLNRFQSIGDVTYSSPLGRSSLIMKLAKLKNILEYHSDEQKAFVRQIKLNFNFWRRALNDENALIDKMIAIASLSNDLSLLSHYLANKEIMEEEGKVIKIFLEPLNAEELDMKEAFKFELRVLVNEWERLFDPKDEVFDNLLAIFIQKNATINQYYENLILTTRCLSKFTSQELAMKIRSKVNNYTDKCSVKPLSRLKLFYNPVGKFLMASSAGAYHTYIARVHDLNGVMSLVRLQLSIKARGDKTIEDVINNSEIRNPYTGERMDYDKAQGLLSFECLDTSSSCKVNL